MRTDGPDRGYNYSGTDVGTGDNGSSLRTDFTAFQRQARGNTHVSRAVRRLELDLGFPHLTPP